MEVSDILLLTTSIFITAFTTHFLVVYLFKLKCKKKMGTNANTQDVNQALIIQHLETINNGMTEMRSDIKELNNNQSEMKTDIATMKVKMDNDEKLAERVKANEKKIEKFGNNWAKIGGMYAAASVIMAAVYAGLKFYLSKQG